MKLSLAVAPILRPWALAAVCAGSLALLGGSRAGAEELPLPTTAEISTYQPQALEFYERGVASLDRVDLYGAYAELTKAASLQPEAINLNRMVSAVSMRLARNNSRTEAPYYYYSNDFAPAPGTFIRRMPADAYFDSAIVALTNVLNQPGIDGKLRRQITNTLRVAKAEKADLTTREARREATGTKFIKAYNKQLADKPKPAPTLGLVGNGIVAPLGAGVGIGFGGAAVPVQQFPGGVNPNGDVGVSNYGSQPTGPGGYFGAASFGSQGGNAPGGGPPAI